MAVRKNRALYQFKVMLRGIDPPVWRRIQIWEDVTLVQLHRALQIVMGWEDFHQHEFRIGRKIIDAKQTRIHDVIQRVGSVFEYVYDFGDYWEHVLLLEAILQPVPDVSYPRCIAGERNCPPEDVGGSGGYKKYLEAMADPEHEEHANMVAWRGPFDPEAFSLIMINQQLQKKFHRARIRIVPPTPVKSHPANVGGPQKASLSRASCAVSGMPRKDRIQIQRDEMVPLELNDRERELIQWHSFADGTLTDRLRVAPKTGERPVFHFTLDDLDELAGFVASEANHAKNKKLKKEWFHLCNRIEAALEGYTDEDD